MASEGKALRSYVSPAGRSDVGPTLQAVIDLFGGDSTLTFRVPWVR